MKYIISSNINYYEKTYLPIVTSLIDSGIINTDIIMIVGGCKDININLENNLNINIIPVEYNSFDLTGLIYVAENNEKFLDTNYFLLHDTCLVGPNFKRLAENVIPNTPIQTLRGSISMNIGMYSLQTLNENKENLSKLKYNPQTEEELQQVKEIFVINEDIIFKLYQDYCYKNNYIGTESETVSISTLRDRFKKPIYQDYFDTIENSKIIRQMGYNALLDFYKFQANWKWGDRWKIGV
jgi:hypothetical protein